MQKYNISECNFVITNVCNLNCPECNRFNNYNFSGNYYWKDNDETYKKWSKRIDFGKINILGGEPLANKDYKNWAIGLREHWPHSKISIITNGTLIKFNDDKFYNFLKDYNIDIEIVLHNADMSDVGMQKIKALQKGRVSAWSHAIRKENFLKAYNQIKADDWTVITSIDEWYNLPEEIKTECVEVYDFSPDLFSRNQLELMESIFASESDELLRYLSEDENGVTASLKLADEFFKSAVIPDAATQTFTVHNSDRELAHAGCEEARGECRQMIQGNLYKCSVSENLATFDKQFNINMTDEYRKQVYGYVPGSVDMSEEDLAYFMANLNKSIPHCSACTMSYDRFKFKATNKKTIFIKKSVLTN
jgi:organic radical activating enzyme